ncbi:unnamed protein product [Toxocara canis]|nr:unnamed protein product [Toxocara canis]
MEYGATVPSENVIKHSLSVPSVRSAESVFISMVQRARCESETKTVLLSPRIDIANKYSRRASVGSQSSALYDSSAIAAVALTNAAEGIAKECISNDINSGLLC